MLSKDYSTTTAATFERVGVSNGLLRSLIPGKCLTIIKDLWGVNGGGVLPMYQPPLFSGINEKKRESSSSLNSCLNPAEQPFKQTKVQSEDSVERDHEKTTKDDGSVSHNSDLKCEKTLSAKEEMPVDSLSAQLDATCDKPETVGSDSKCGNPLSDKVSSVWDGVVESCDESETAGDHESEYPTTYRESEHMRDKDGGKTSRNAREVPSKAKINHDEIARENRDRKATKSDDAEVPEYLWLEHLVQAGERRWTDEEIMKLLSAMHTVREGCLRWWKRRVTTSLLTYVKLRYETYDDGKRPEEKLGSISGVRCQEPWWKQA